MKVLRWIAVLPAAVAAAVLVSFPVHWFVMLINGSPSADGAPHMLSSIPPDALERFGLAYFAPFAFITAGAYVAPRFKLATAAALAGLIAGFLIMAHIFASEHLAPTPAWQRAVTWLLWAAAIGAALVWTRQKSLKQPELNNVTGWN